MFVQSPEQSGKVEYERERMLGIGNKWMYVLAIPSSLSRSYSTFPLCSGDNLNWKIAVYSTTSMVWCWTLPLVFSDSHIFRPAFTKYNCQLYKGWWACWYNWGYMSERREKYTRPTQILSHPFYVGVRKPQGYYGNALLWWYAGCIFFTFRGTLGLKCGPKHGKDEVIPLVFSYISPFVHSYNPNYTNRLISPCIIGN
jgi:hypothetical protein